MKSIKLIFAFITLITFFLSTSAWALSSDKNKPVEVEADSFNLDDFWTESIASTQTIISEMFAHPRRPKPHQIKNEIFNPHLRRIVPNRRSKS